VDLTPPNRPPTINEFLLPKATAKKAYTFRMTASDPDGDAVTFEKVSGPSDMKIDADGTIRWKPSKQGQYDFTVRISDGKADLTRTLTLDVKEPSAPSSNQIPSWIWIVLLVAIVAAVAGAALALRKRPAAGGAAKTTKPATPPTAPAKEDTLALDDVFLIYKDGRLISHHTRKLRPDRDDQILSSMFTAVQEFITQSFGEEDGSKINEISYGQNKILIEHGKHIVVAAVVAGEGTRRMHDEMHATVHNIEAECSSVLEKWSGDAKDLKESKKWVQKLVTGEHIEEIGTPGKPAEPLARPTVVPPSVQKTEQAEQAPAPPQAEEQLHELTPISSPESARRVTVDTIQVAPAEPSKHLEHVPIALPVGAQPIPNPFRDETEALGTLSSLPRGLPSSLSGKSMDELAEDLSRADFAETTDGDIIVRIKKKWYHGDQKEVDTYLQPYREG